MPASSSSYSRQEAVLYRCFDKSGALLYIGVTINHNKRFSQHEQKQPWWRDVDKITLVPYPERHLAMDAERAAIDAENPLHNVRRGFRPIHRPTIVLLDSAEDVA